MVSNQNKRNRFLFTSVLFVIPEMLKKSFLNRITYIFLHISVDFVYLQRIN